MKPAKIEPPRSSRKSPTGWRRKIANPRAWGILLFVLLAVAGWRAWALASRPAHMNELADELGSIGGFIGTPAADDAGTRVSFFRGTETGAGLFVCDLSSGRQRLLHEDAGTNLPAQFGWSPDGKLLAFRSRKNGENVLLICNADSGQIETTVFSWAQDLVWLSPSSFVFSNGQLMRVDKHPDTGWGRPYRFAKLIKTSPENKPVRYPPIGRLMAVSADSVVWAAWNGVWEWKFHVEAPQKIWSGSATDRVLECRYSKESGNFLLRLRDPAGEYLASYSRDSKQLISLGRIDDTNAADLMWVNHGKGYAYLVNESGSHLLFLKADCADGRPVQQLPLYGVREALTANDTCIYAAGCLDNQPKGIVEFDAVSGSARYVVPSQVNFTRSQNVAFLSGTITNSLGSIHAYKVWSPVHFDPRKKYPLVLDQWTHGWFLFAETAANVGAFYVSVERPDWENPQISEWEQDVKAAYQVMSRNPNIDTNRLYLCGSCAESEFLVRLMNDEPTLWRGVIIHTAIAFPDLSRTHVKKMLINYGNEDDRNMIANIKQFQEAAARSGIPVTVVPHDSGHFYISSASTRESTREMMQFLVE